jgi:hypothetical protein
MSSYFEEERKTIKIEKNIENKCAYPSARGL